MQGALAALNRVGRQASVERCQPAAVRDGQGQQIGIRQLARGKQAILCDQTVAQQLMPSGQNAWPGWLSKE